MDRDTSRNLSSIAHDDTAAGRSRHAHALPLLGILLSGALIAACYGFSLRLPFFFDDLPVLTWLGGHSLVDVWTGSSENAYYRPLTFTVYKLAMLLPKGAQQVALHASNVLLHWLNAILAMLVVSLWTRTAKAVPTNLAAPLLALALFSVFPFLFNAVPWVTAMPHLLVTTLTLVAVYAALRAGRGSATAWWAISLGATALAPLAHESGIVCGAIVAGIAVIHRGRRSGWRPIAWAVGGVALNLAAIGLRALIPGVEPFNPDGLHSGFENIVFTVHGLIYPVGPLIGYLVREHGWHDLTTVLAAGALFAALLAWLAIRGRRSGGSNGRWMACALWWWACGSLPAAVRFRFGGLVNSPRFYALAAVGIVGLWAGLIEELCRRLRPGWTRSAATAVLTAAILVPNVTFLSAQRSIYLGLIHVYQQVLDAAAPAENAPLGFVNLPAWLAPKRQTYALAKDGATVLPLYTNVREFIAVNAQPRPADNVMFVHTLQELDNAYWGFHGDWPDWEQMRQFAIDHRTVWLAHYERSQQRFVLHEVGRIVAAPDAASAEALARFEGGPTIAAVSTKRFEEGHWTIALTWQAAGPVNAEVFLHVTDASGKLVIQADGPALGGLVPMRIWQPGDQVYDIRHVYVSSVDLPPGERPYTVLVGVYDASGRFPAFLNGVRCASDAVPIATIGP